MTKIRVFNKSIQSLGLLTGISKASYNPWTPNLVGYGAFEFFVNSLSIIELDFFVQVIRNGNIENMFMIKKIKYMFREGKLVCRIAGPDIMHIMRMYFVDARSGSPQADKSDFADDMAKEIVTEQMSQVPGLNVERSRSKGPNIDYAFSHREMFRVLTSISQKSAALGNKMFFAVVPTSDNTFEFRTAFDYMFSDISHKPIDIASGTLEYNAMSRKTRIVAGGRGIQDDRTIVESSTDQANILGHDSFFYDARSSTFGSIQNEADQKLWELRQKILFDAEINNSELTPYGLWRTGSKVKVSFLGEQFICNVVSVLITVDKGEESIVGKLEVQSWKN